MSRMQHRIYCQQNRKRRIRRFTLLAAGLLIVCGLLSRFRSAGVLTVDPLLQPTPTPVTVGFDETNDSRIVTLPSAVWYALQTGIYADPAAAEATAALYTDRGAPGFVLHQDGKYRVLIACYGTKDAAESVRTRLQERQSVETYVYEWPVSEVALQMTGMKGQLDVVEAGLSLLHDAAVQLRDLSTACDSGEYTLDEAFHAIDGLKSQFHLLTDTLTARFRQPFPAFVSRELSQLEGALSLIAPLSQCDSATDLSARLKLQSMALYQQLCELHMLLLDM